MTAFRCLLVLICLSLLLYTAQVVAAHGMNLLPIFFGDIAGMSWPGQFNYDFLCMLLLSGLWVAWRHGFSPAGLLLGLLASFGGALFLSLYLLIVSLQVGGDSRALLLGPQRAGADRS